MLFKNKNKDVEELVIDKKDRVYLTILKYIAIYFICLIFAKAQIGELSPFLFAFYFALLYVGFDEKIAAAFVITSAVVVNYSLEYFLITTTVVAVGLINFYIHKLSKNRIHLITNFVVYLIF